MVEMKKAITIKLLFAFILAAGILLVSCGSPLHPQDLGKYLQDLFIIEFNIYFICHFKQLNE